MSYVPYVHLSHAIDNKCIKFADDMTLVIKFENIAMFNTDLNKALTYVKKWMDINDSSINISKTKLMAFKWYNYTN